ncbi:hypothetical protein GCM10027614_06920 [Micromonospora vulcania]
MRIDPEVHTWPAADRLVEFQDRDARCGVLTHRHTVPEPAGKGSATLSENCVVRVRARTRARTPHDAPGPVPVGHFIPEEAPEETTRQLFEFLK